MIFLCQVLYLNIKAFHGYSQKILLTAWSFAWHFFQAWAPAASAWWSGHWLLCSHYSSHIHGRWIFLLSYFSALSWNWPGCQHRMLKQPCNSWVLEPVSWKTWTDKNGEGTSFLVKELNLSKTSLYSQGRKHALRKDHFILSSFRCSRAVVEARSWINQTLWTMAHLQYLLFWKLFCVYVC